MVKWTVTRRRLDRCSPDPALFTHNIPVSQLALRVSFRDSFPHSIPALLCCWGIHSHSSGAIATSNISSLACQSLTQSTKGSYFTKWKFLKVCWKWESFHNQKSLSQSKGFFDSSVFFLTFQVKKETNQTPKQAMKTLKPCLHRNNAINRRSDHLRTKQGNKMVEAGRVGLLCLFAFSIFSMYLGLNSHSWSVTWWLLPNREEEIRTRREDSQIKMQMGLTK